ncbi:MAG: carboxypeptidase-like regulatory domain-containing protein [Pirellulales bacterium]
MVTKKLCSSLVVPLIVVLTLLVAGCSREKREPVAPAAGKIQWDGKPLAEATVVFHRLEGEGRSLTVRTLNDGTFRLTTHEPNDGAPPGRYAVTVELRDWVRDGDEAVRSGRNLLPPKYASPRTSGLECVIAEGDNQLPVWNLSSR